MTARGKPAHHRIRGRADWERLDPAEREARHRAFEALHEMRARGISLRQAAREVGTTPRSVHRYAGDSLILERRRYRATPSDRSYQRMAVLSTEGLRDVDTRGSRVRSRVARHWNAVRDFGATGDEEILQSFVAKRVGGVVLATDPDDVEEFLRRGEIDIDDIYL
jgi:hypothetical protein